MSFHNDTFRGVCYWYTPYYHDQCGVITTLVVASMSCIWVSGTHCPKKTYKLGSVCRRDVFRNAEFLLFTRKRNFDTIRAVFKNHQKERSQEMIEITVYEAIGLLLIAFAAGVGMGAFLLYVLVKRATNRIENEMGDGYGLE